MFIINVLHKLYIYNIFFSDDCFSGRNTFKLTVLRNTGILLFWLFKKNAYSPLYNIALVLV